MIKVGGLQLDQAGYSCAAICNEHKAKEVGVGWWGLWWFKLGLLAHRLLMVPFKAYMLP